MNSTGIMDIVYLEPSFMLLQRDRDKYQNIGRDSAGYFHRLLAPNKEITTFARGELRIK